MNDQGKLRALFLKLGKDYKLSLQSRKSTGTPVLHGMEMEGFVLDKAGQLVLKSASKILPLIDGDIETSDESGAHQLEYISDAHPFDNASFKNLYSELHQKRDKMQIACESFGYNFVPRAIPFYLPLNTENNPDYFNGVDDYELERQYFKADDTLRGDEHYYEVKSKNGEAVTVFTDHCFCLAFVCGTPKNIIASDDQEIAYVFNVIRDNNEFKERTNADPKEYIRATLGDPTAKEALARLGEKSCE